MLMLAKSYVMARSHWIIALIIAVSQGWDCGVPRDPHQTLKHVRGGMLRVGVTDAPPWVERKADGTYAGIEAELVASFAQSLNAEIEWVNASNQELFEHLRNFEIDILIGGLTKSSPWAAHVAFTRPYFIDRDPVLNKKREHAFAVPPGENGFLLSLDRHLEAASRTLTVRAGLEPDR